MSTIKDQAYLRTRQFQDATNLTKRITLHDRFSTNAYGWHRWVFDHLLSLPSRCRILELGCGPGQLWLQNMDRIPSGWQITLSDFSEGMVREAETQLRDTSHNFTFAVFDAQAIPFAAESLDVVLAHHMLFFIPDRVKAFTEVARVLRAGGGLHAATNGQENFKEIRQMVYEVAPDIPFLDGIDFTLENGAAELSRWFSDVTLDRYQDALLVTEAAPLLDFILSTRAGASFTPALLDALTAAIEKEIAAYGAFHVTKALGLFVARKP